MMSRTDGCCVDGCERPPVTRDAGRWEPSGDRRGRWVENVVWVAAAPVGADTGMTSPGPPGSDAVARPAAPDSRHETGAGTISS